MWLECTPLEAGYLKCILHKLAVRFLSSLKYNKCPARCWLRCCRALHCGKQTGLMHTGDFIWISIHLVIFGILKILLAYIKHTKYLFLAKSVHTASIVCSFKNSLCVLCSRKMQQQKTDPAGPELSCVSMKSNRSMFEPIFFKDRQHSDNQR